MGHYKNMLIMVIIFTFIASICFMFIRFSEYNNEPSNKNNMGLAMLGIIPTAEVCKHDISSYKSTNIIAENQGGHYLILENKIWGDSCFYRIG